MIIHKEFHLSSADTNAHNLNALGKVVVWIVDDLQSPHPAATLSSQKVAMVLATGSDMSRLGLAGDRRAA